MDTFCPQKGVEHALDYMCDSLNIVAIGIAHWLHDGWGHSYPVGDRHRCSTGPGHSRTKTLVGIWTLAGEGEVFGEEAVSRARKILLNLRILGTRRRRKSLNQPFHHKLTERSNR